jgi:O-antigen/teichoic acid export membrane protein
LWFVPYAIQKNIALPTWIISSYQNNPTVIFIFIAGTIASATTFLLLLPTLFKFKLQLDFELLKKMLRYAFPILIAGLAYVTNENLDKLLLGDMIGEQQMGVYAACYKLGVFMTLFIMAFRLGAEPFFFNHSEEKNATTTYATILNWFVIAGAFFMIFIVAFLDIFAPILLGSDEYFEALMIVPIILLANLLLGIYHNLAIWYKLTDKTRFGMYFSIIGAIITIVLNVVMIPKIGFMASAWATLAAYGIMMLLSYFIGKKHYPVPYNIKKTVSYLVSATLISFVSFNYFRENYFVSVGLVIIFGFLIYFNEKKEILAILKR